MFPKGLRPLVDYNSWELPNVFKNYAIRRDTRGRDEEGIQSRYRLLCGDPKEAEYDAHDTIKSIGYKSWTIGKVVL